jgi:hypothetical protein
MCVSTSVAHFLIWKLSSGESLGSKLDWCNDSVLDVIPLLGVSHLGAWWRSYVALLRCFPFFKGDPRRRYACHR